MVLMRYRRTKQSHDSIAGKLIDCPLISMDLVHHDLKTPIHDLMDFFRVELFRNRSVVGNICEENRHQLPLPF